MAQVEFMMYLSERCSSYKLEASVCLEKEPKYTVRHSSRHIHATYWFPEVSENHFGLAETINQCHSCFMFCICSPKLKLLIILHKYFHIHISELGYLTILLAYENTTPTWPNIHMSTPDSNKC
jgi:hypothetical protein